MELTRDYNKWKLCFAFQIELSMDIELAMPEKARKRMEFSVASEVVYPNKLKKNSIKYFVEGLMDGPILRMDKILEYAAAIVSVSTITCVEVHVFELSTHNRRQTLHTYSLSK